jgi:hypothetical protein
MPVSAMLVTGGVVFYNYFCGEMFFVAGGDGKQKQRQEQQSDNPVLMALRKQK